MKTSSVHESCAPTDSAAAPRMLALRVWWIPQIPGKSFDVPVQSIEEAALLLRTLADYDIFQFENRIKPDYCNAGGLCVYEDGEWVDWYNDDGDDIDVLMRRGFGQAAACHHDSASE